MTTSIAGFDPIAASVELLKAKFAGVTYDVQTTDGMKAAKADRAALKEYRLAVEAKRVELKEPHLLAGREIDEHAKTLTKEITTLETERDSLIKAEEQRKAEIKRKAEQAERDRIAAEERAKAAEREAELKRENEALKAQIEAARAAAPDPAIEALKSAAFAAAGVPSDDDEFTPHANGKPAAHDPALLDLMADDGFKPRTVAAPAFAHRPQYESRAVRRMSGDNLPTANEVAAALSEHAKKRTNIRHVTDVLEAIRSILNAGD
jgi:vacuolar-type H+-ATPase subunit I/STV1